MSHGSNKSHNASFNLHKTYFEISGKPIVSAIKMNPRDLGVKVFLLLQRFTSRQNDPLKHIPLNEIESQAQRKSDDHLTQIYIL